MTTLQLQIASGNDDGSEPGSGTPNLSGASEISMLPNSPATWLALRFTGITVPQGATINAPGTTLEVYVHNAAYDDPDVDIYLDDADNSAALSTSANNISGRALTTAKATWTATGIGTGWKSPGSLAAVVQEVTDRAGWASGNAITVLLDARSAANSIRIRPYEYDTSLAAKLTIDYTLPYVNGAVSLVAAGTLTAVGQRVAQAAATLAGAASFSAAGQRIVSGAVTLSGAAALTATATASSGSATVSVSNNADDAYESSTGAVSLNNTALNINNSDAPFVILLFRDLPIPAGATLTSNTKLEVYCTIYDDPAVRIRVEQTLSPATPTATTNNISARTLLSPEVAWNATNLGTASYVQSPSVAALVQEWMGLSGYTQGASDIAFVLSSGGAGHIRFFARDSLSNYARLFLEWTTAGGETYSGVVALAGAGTLTAAGQTILQGAAALSGAGALTATGQRIAAGAVVMSGAGSLAATGQLVAQGAVVLSGVATLGAAPQAVAQGAATLAGVGTLTATGQMIANAAAALAGVGSLNAVGQRIQSGAVVLAGVGTLAATGQQVAQGAAALNGVGGLSAVGQRVAQGSAAMNGAATLTAVGTRISATEAAVTMSGAAAMTAAGQLIANAAVALAGVGQLAGAGQRVVSGAVVLAGAASLAATSQAVANAAVVLSGVATFAPAGQFVVGAAVVLAGAATVTASGQTVTQGAVALAGSAALVGSGQRIIGGAVVLVGAAGLDATGQRVAFGAVVLAGEAVLTAAVQIAMMHVVLRAARRDFGLTAPARVFTLTVEDR